MTRYSTFNWIISNLALRSILDHTACQRPPSPRATIIKSSSNAFRSLRRLLHNSILKWPFSSAFTFAQDVGSRSIWPSPMFPWLTAYTFPIIAFKSVENIPRYLGILIPESDSCHLFSPSTHCSGEQIIHLRAVSAREKADLCPESVLQTDRSAVSKRD